MKAAATSALILVIIVMIMNAGGGGFGVNGQGVTSWCVAKPSASTEELKAFIDSKCQNTPEEHELCSEMWSGGTCYEPDTAYNHASLLVNKLYYKKGKTLPCDNGILVRTDPSYGSCKFD
ncbi:hypothetical protein P8452_77106 [Trifolium repens]|nr:hypothetical protein P8452_77106 [Trifolium repens]